MQILHWLTASVALLALSGRAQAQSDDDDDDDNTPSQTSDKPSAPRSIFHPSHDRPDDDNCRINRGTRIGANMDQQREDDAAALLEAAAHANDPLLVRRTYNALYLTDENGTPGEDFAAATDAKKKFEETHADLVRALTDPARARQFALVHLDLGWDGQNRLLQAASGAGDPLLLESVQPLLKDSDLQSGHGEWVTLHPAFVAEVNDPAKAKAYVTAHVTVLSGTDEEHRVWYAAQHAGIPSIEARAKLALALGGDRDDLFNKAQTSWEQAHAGDLAALQKDAARTYVAEHLGVSPVPVTGTDDEHLLIAAASASGDAALLARARHQIGLVDYSELTVKGIAFDPTQKDWEVAHADAIKAVGDPAAYVRVQLKPTTYEFPEIQLQTFLAGKHASDHDAQSNAMRAYHINGKCQIAHFLGNADLYSDEHPEFVATVDTPAKADAFFQAHLAVTSYSDPWGMTGLVLGASLGVGLVTSTGDASKQAASSLFTGAVPIRLEAEYRPSAAWAIGGSFTELLASIDTSKCSGTGIGFSCGVDHGWSIGGYLGFRLVPKSKWQPWLTLGIDYVSTSIFVTTGGTSTVNSDMSGVGFRARAQANFTGNTSRRIGPFAELSYASLGKGASSMMPDESLGLLVFGISGAFAL